jgi:hypothetical protein
LLKKLKFKPKSTILASQEKIIHVQKIIFKKLLMFDFLTRYVRQNDDSILWKN